MNTFQGVALDREELLVAELHRLGVHHLARFKVIDPPPEPPAPLDLLTGLATSEDARLQSALILLFLRQPTYSDFLPAALAQLSEATAAEVTLYYQAAVYLQVELEPVLRAYVPGWRPLPDLFSAQLQLLRPGTTSLATALQRLGERHRQQSGWDCNWAGSYQQNIPWFLKHLGDDN